MGSTTNQNVPALSEERRFEVGGTLSGSSEAMLLTGMPSAQEMLVYQAWAKNAVDSQMYRSVGKESAVMMIMLSAREYGIGPAQALNGGLNIIEGKVELSARMMSALIRRAKHTLKILEDTELKCTIYGKRADTGEEHTITYTIAQAQIAGLIKEKGGWKKVPDDMLFARAMSKLARRLFSDVIGIGYVQGEISDSRASNEVVEPSVESKLETAEQEVELYFDLMAKFPDLQEKELFNPFINDIAAHYKISRLEVIKKLMMDTDKSYILFKEWKAKRKS